MTKGYATTTETAGIDYRWIADEMTRRGHVLNHSSARNYVLRAMRKFVDELVPDVEDPDALARDADFQSAIAHALNEIDDVHT